MPQENVEIMPRYYEAWFRRDPSEMGTRPRGRASPRPRKRVGLSRTGFHGDSVWWVSQLLMGSQTVSAARA
jgi:hypothetical protein